MDTKQEIMNYIEMNENSGALLLTGKWGCGKTFLIKQIAEELNVGADYCVAVISLFDVDDIEALHKKVKEEYLQLSISKTGKFFQKGSALLGAIKDIAEEINEKFDDKNLGIITGVTGTVLALDKANFVTVNNKIGEKQFVLVFDDFERCKIKKDKLLGGINEYLENKNIKTIIIADETRISKRQYKKFKEKVISRTLKITSNYDIIIHQIIEQYKETNNGYKDFLLKYELFFRMAFIDSKSENIRSIISCMVEFERLFLMINTIEFSEETIKEIVYSFCAMMLEEKLGNVCNSEYGYIIKDHGEKYNQHLFTSQLECVFAWIVDGVYDEELIVNSIKDRYLNETIDFETRFLLYGINEFEESEAVTELNILKEKAYNGELSFDNLYRFMEKLSFIKSENIGIEIDVDYLKINKGIDIRFNNIKNGIIDEQNMVIKIEPYDYPHVIDTINLIYFKLSLFKYKKVTWITRRKWIDFLKNTKLEQDYEFENKYIDCFDNELCDLLYDSYKMAQNGTKVFIINSFALLSFWINNYNIMSEVELSKNNLQLLKNKITDLNDNTTDKLTIYNNNKFIKIIDEKIEILNNSFSS